MTADAATAQPPPTGPPSAEVVGGIVVVVADSLAAARRALVRCVATGDAAQGAHAVGSTGRTEGAGCAGVPRAPTAVAPRAPGGDGGVDLREVKREAARVLPRGHPVREGLLREPDVLPLAEGRAKIEAYLRVLLMTRNGH